MVMPVPFRQMPFDAIPQAATLLVVCANLITLPAAHELKLIVLAPPHVLIMPATALRKSASICASVPLQSTVQAVAEQSVQVCALAAPDQTLHASTIRASTPLGRWRHMPFPPSRVASLRNRQSTEEPYQ